MAGGRPATCKPRARHVPRTPLTPRTLHYRAPAPWAASATWVATLVDDAVHGRLEDAWLEAVQRRTKKGTQLLCRSPPTDNLTE